MARVYAAWPEARDKMKSVLKRWSSVGFGNLRLEWLLRVMTAVMTGEAYFSALRNIDVPTLQTDLEKNRKEG